MGIQDVTYIENSGRENLDSKSSVEVKGMQIYDKDGTLLSTLGTNITYNFNNVIKRNFRQIQTNKIKLNMNGDIIIIKELQNIVFCVIFKEKSNKYLIQIYLLFLAFSFLNFNFSIVNDLSFSNDLDVMKSIKDKRKDSLFLTTYQLLRFKVFEVIFLI